MRRFRNLGMTTEAAVLAGIDMPRTISAYPVANSIVASQVLMESRW